MRGELINNNIFASVTYRGIELRDILAAKEKRRARASYQFQGAEGILDCRTEEAHH